MSQEPLLSGTVRSKEPFSREKALAQLPRSHMRHYVLHCLIDQKSLSLPN